MNEKKKIVLYIILLIILSISTIGFIVANWLGLLPFEIVPIAPILLWFMAYYNKKLRVRQHGVFYFYIFSHIQKHGKSFAIFQKVLKLLIFLSEIAF